MHRKPLQLRVAFTLVELLLVLAVLAVILALLLSALQRVREAANDLQCKHNLKQLGVALHNYHTAHECLPPAMMTWKKPPWDPSNPVEQYPWFSWIGRIMPYLEQENLASQADLDFQRTRGLPTPNSTFLWEHAGFSTVIETLTCPSDSRQMLVSYVKDYDIKVAFTGYLGVNGTDLLSRNGVLFPEQSIHLDEIADGASNTIMVGERPPSSGLIYGWWYAGAGQYNDPMALDPVWICDPERYTGSLDFVLGAAEINVGGSCNSRQNETACSMGSYRYAPGNVHESCDRFHFWSLHPGGANFLFADGSAKYIAYTARDLMPALATRAGGEIVGLEE